jgi:hypothetical protein
VIRIGPTLTLMLPSSALRWALAGALALFVVWAMPAIADESGPRWAALAPAQQQALAPLQRDWASIDANRKQKWLEVAARFPSMPAEERQRVQERMAAWAALSPAERATARWQFQETRQISPEERQARWQAYQALPETERQRLAQNAKPAARAAAPVRSTTAASAPGTQPVAKSNLVAATRQPPTKPVAPTVQQAKPGATTTSMATKAAPPSHHQPGLPKIVTTPGFVDPATLLPRRGPQGAAAIRTGASADPTEQP